MVFPGSGRSPRHHEVPQTPLSRARGRSCPSGGSVSDALPQGRQAAPESQYPSAWRRRGERQPGGFGVSRRGYYLSKPALAAAGV